MHTEENILMKPTSTHRERKTSFRESFQMWQILSKTRKDVVSVISETQKQIRVTWRLH